MVWESETGKNYSQSGGLISADDLNSHQSDGKEMSLYVVTNGFVGETYVRVYVWAPDEVAAVSLAREAFKKKAEAENYDKSYWSYLRCLKVFSNTDVPFCTLPSDSGFHMEDEEE
jgi:hypothetical protein